MLRTVILNWHQVNYKHKTKSTRQAVLDIYKCFWQNPVSKPPSKKEKNPENRCRVMVWIELTLSHAACALLGFVLYYNIGINITYQHISQANHIPKKKKKTLVHILYFVVTDNKNIIFNELTGKITMEWHHIINNEFWSTLTHSMNIST